MGVELSGGRPRLVVLAQTARQKVRERLRPHFLVPQCRRWISDDFLDGAVGQALDQQRRVRLGHLNHRDAQRPDVTFAAGEKRFALQDLGGEPENIHE